VTWYGAKSFALFYGLDLPTEAEWEYASRSGRQYKYGTDDGTISGEKANYRGTAYLGRPVEVGSYPPNPFGLFDLSGNVWEWCHDFYTVYPEGNVTNPTGAEEGTQRVKRGGCWIQNEFSCRSAYRGSHIPNGRDLDLGFRVVRRPGEISY
jgi:formylglycine-generating enzyme required for sulfatase activity